MESFKRFLYGVWQWNEGVPSKSKKKTTELLRVIIEQKYWKLIFFLSIKNSTLVNNAAKTAFSSFVYVVEHWIRFVC